jgi:hypothetical protein
MADPSLFDPIRIPAQVLIALDWRPWHFATQPFHYLIRISHIASMALFSGGIALLDLRLIGWRAESPLRPFAELVMPWLYASFAIAMLTGFALFFYDPVHTGSRAYFTPKLIAIVLGVANTAVYRQTAFGAAFGGAVPASARAAGGLSLLFWSAVIVFSCLNGEAMPKLLLR